MNLWRNCTIAGKALHIPQHPKDIPQCLDRACKYQYLAQQASCRTKLLRRHVQVVGKSRRL